MSFRQRNLNFLHRLSLVIAASIILTTTPANAGEYLNGIKWKEPGVVTPGKTDSAAPSDAIVLFDGKSLKDWKNGERWEVKDGVAYSGKGKIVSNQSFGDCQLHLEWTAPVPVKGNGQGRGNSGIFLMDRYEIQVLDSYDNATYFDGQAGAIYKQTPPAVNAMRPPGQWNTYDIFWTAPRFDDDGKLVSPAYITAIENGFLILNHFELKGVTPYDRPPAYKQHPATSPLALGDAGIPVGFRNIWVRNFTPAKGEQVRKPFIRNGKKETPIED